MGNKAPSGPLPEFGPMAIRCPPEDANPLTIHGTREAMLDLSNEVGRRSQELYAQLSTQLDPTRAQLRQNFGPEDVPETMPKLINTLKDVNEQVARIYCLVKRQSKVAGMAYRPLLEGEGKETASGTLAADWGKASGGGGLPESANTKIGAVLGSAKGEKPMELADWLEKHPVDAEAAKTLEEKWASQKGKEPDVAAAQRKIRDIVRSMPTAAPNGRADNPLSKNPMETIKLMRKSGLQDFGKYAGAMELDTEDGSGGAGGGGGGGLGAAEAGEGGAPAVESPAEPGEGAAPAEGGEAPPAEGGEPPAEAAEA